MDSSNSYQSAQRVLKQRNVLAIVAVAEGALVFIMAIALMSQDREIVLQPISQSPLVVSSSGVSKEYLEKATRDTALLALNRSPETLNYWMESLLALADPSQRGALKRDLMKVVKEQQGSQISQFFTLDTIRVDPESLESEVSGVLHTIAGSKEVTTQPRRFRFSWAYSGLSLKLRSFGMVEKKETEQ